MEGSGAVYAENTVQWRDHIRSVIGVREDQFEFDVTDKMRNTDGSCTLASDPLGCDSGHRRAAIFSPKLGIILCPWGDRTFFINAGDGYHSNDARGVTRSGQNPEQAAVMPLTRARSAELGISAKPLPHWETTLDVFKLKLKSELVFSGDAGVHPGVPRTLRARFQIQFWLRGGHGKHLVIDQHANAARPTFFSTGKVCRLLCDHFPRARVSHLHDHIVVGLAPPPDNPAQRLIGAQPRGDRCIAAATEPMRQSATQPQDKAAERIGNAFINGPLGFVGLGRQFTLLASDYSKM